MVEANLLLVESMLARAAHELDLSRRQSGGTVAVRLPSDEKRADVGGEKLEKPLARLLVYPLHAGHGRGPALEVVFKGIVPAGEVAHEAARRHADVAELLPLAEYDGEHHDRAKELNEDDSLSHQVGTEESVD